MKYGIYFQRSFWLVVPEFLYLVLLLGGWIAIVVSVGMTLAGIIRKKEKKCIIKWVVVLILALAIVVMAMQERLYRIRHSEGNVVSCQKMDNAT